MYDDDSYNLGFIFGWVFVLVVLAIILMHMLGCDKEETPVEVEEPAKITQPTMSPLGPVYTEDGNTIRMYVFTDPDTDIQYLVSDRGGVTPRILPDFEDRGM